MVIVATNRMSKLVAVNALAFFWVYHIGVHKDKDKPLKCKLKSNSRPQASFFVLGLDLLIEGLRLVFFNNDTSVFRQLVSFLTVKGEVGLIFCRMLRKFLYHLHGDIFHYLSKFI